MNRIIDQLSAHEQESTLIKQETPPENSPRLLTTHEAAQYLRLSARTLERYRVEGTGPSYTKLGPGLRAKVVYRHTDLDAWLKGFHYSSTSEYALKS